MVFLPNIKIIDHKDFIIGLHQAAKTPKGAAYGIDLFNGFIKG